MQIGPYLVERELARGGQGVIYLARDPRAGREVVVKLLQAMGEAQARRLEREARAMAQLSHPHVVGLHDLGLHAGRPYLVQPYVPGESCQDRLDRDGPFPVPTALRLTAELVQALQAVHAAGLVHRDLKPANVLIDEGGHALLTDFGLVKKVGPGQAETLSLSVRGALLGSPGYWPPEQAFGQHERVGPWSDVYALGAVAYALLAGRPPRDASSLQAALAAFERRPARLRGLRAEAPAWAERLLEACLQVDVDDRPTLVAVREALAEERFGVEASGGRGLALALGGAAGALALGAALVWPRESAPPASPAPSAQATAQVEAPPPEEEPDPAAERYPQSLLDQLGVLERALEAELEPAHRERLTQQLYEVSETLGDRVLEDVLALEGEPADWAQIEALRDGVPGGDVVGEGQLLRYVAQVLEDRGEPGDARLRALTLVRAYQRGDSEALVDLGLRWPLPGAVDAWRWRALRYACYRVAAREGNAGAIAVLAYDLLRDPWLQQRACVPTELAQLRKLLGALDRSDSSFVMLNRSKQLRLTSAQAYLALREPRTPRADLEALFTDLRQRMDALHDEPDEEQLLAFSGDVIGELWERLR